MYVVQVVEAKIFDIFCLHLVKTVYATNFCGKLSKLSYF